MPEGVEVRLSTEMIKPLVLNKRVINVFTGKNSRYKSSKPEGFANFLNYLSNNICRVVQIGNKGKFMYWQFTDDWYMFCTFGMSGQWATQEGKHPCLGLYLGEDPTASFETIYFNDPRHFGTIKFVQGSKNLHKKLNELGWDPLATDLNTHFDTIYNKVHNAGKPIGQVLMDQKIFAGVGNYIRAEALYLSRISPWRFSRLVSKDDLYTLCQSLIEVMKESYQYQGATIHTYTTVYGEEGRYSSCFKVYGQDKDPLGNSVKKGTTPDGRTIHWCPSLQS